MKHFCWKHFLCGLGVLGLVVGLTTPASALRIALGTDPNGPPTSVSTIYVGQDVNGTKNPALANRRATLYAWVVEDDPGNDAEGVGIGLDLDQTSIAGPWDPNYPNGGIAMTASLGTVWDDLLPNGAGPFVGGIDADVTNVDGGTLGSDPCNPVGADAGTGTLFSTIVLRGTTLGACNLDLVVSSSGVAYPSDHVYIGATDTTDVGNAAGTGADDNASSAAAEVVIEILLIGDGSFDGYVDGGDIQPLLNHVAGSPAHAQRSPVTNDVNGDGFVDGGDIQPLLNAIAGTPPPLQVPEPVTFSLMLGGLGLVALRRRR
jgi:hypothetical protein